MLLLVVLLIAQMPALVVSRSIPGHSKVIIQGIQTIESLSLEENEAVQMSLTSDGETQTRRKRGVNDPIIWPNKTIPFVFQEPFSRRNKKRVLKAISIWEENTCIRFVDRTDEEYFARFEINTFTCESSVGLKMYPIYENIGQPVKLTTACLRKSASILHELGHLIGLYHEHQRPDRDEYIQIHYENIAKSKHYSQFEKYDFETYGPYDFESIMHYTLNSFGKLGKNTMEVMPNVTVPEGVEIGLVQTISTLDAEKVELMYNCSNNTLPDADIEPMVEERSADNIYAGEQVALLVKGMAGSNDFSDNSWLSCTQQQCSVNSCPGNLLKAADKETCPFNIFTLHKLSAGSMSELSSAVVRVGDTIVLEHRMMTETGEEKSFFVSCDPSTLVCSLSLQCTANIHDYNTTSQCRDNSMIVRAEGKEVGTPITHQDIIGFEYTVDSHEFFTEQCAFGCDPLTNVCAKELCIHADLNSLDLTAGDSTGEAPKCGKDMFLIQKF